MLVLAGNFFQKTRAGKELWATVHHIIALDCETCYIHIFCLEDRHSSIHTLVGWLWLSWHIQPTSQCVRTAEGWITQNLSPPSESFRRRPLPQKMFPYELSYSLQRFAVLSRNSRTQTSLEVCCDSDKLWLPYPRFSLVVALRLLCETSQGVVPPSFQICNHSTACFLN